MNFRIKYFILISAFSYFLPGKLNAQTNINPDEVSRIVKTLSADNMRGRKALTPDIDKAATFISAEFKKAGLQTWPGLKSFEQSFPVYEINSFSSSVVLDGTTLTEPAVLIKTGAKKVEWNQKSNSVKILTRIEASDNLIEKFQETLTSKESGLVLIDTAHAELFKRYKNYLSRNNLQLNLDSTTLVFALTSVKNPQSVQVSAQNAVTKKTLKNIVGYLPGTTRKNEYVIFSAHYDHIGILNPVNGDSIANGADDDATGTTAVITLANYFKKQKKNARSLIFVAFTAEEIGGYGAQYFSKQLDPQQVTAMFNIEMIGKESQFGKNAGFITGYDKSNFGQIIQKNLVGSSYSFQPDPYLKENLFYRSDNATLARLGVPAHTLSTDKIDTDKLYHSVDDEFASLDIANMTNIIKAIAQAARSIIAGQDTPTRIKPEDVK
ncbi:M20/M25/M40 family metallo-hydrolase [Adhaeribacter radiodurans]|uniref:M20/M25/M40 family metallo-hydrolase n=1 Tax=Adhaeribacter radiodurans TaxID=2745197 RepID=A0A7L7L9Z5_9BACT|nr:M20/M25/M40 family metallo-hydrolase [Adhaeribacter radiodurans]QMU29557.1 M20/M25/M40 family metallo-hydrolase [Adhaeribacter radiodurans]